MVEFADGIVLLSQASAVLCFALFHICCHLRQTVFLLPQHLLELLGKFIQPILQLLLEYQLHVLLGLLKLIGHIGYLLFESPDLVLVFRLPPIELVLQRADISACLLNLILPSLELFLLEPQLLLP